MKRSLIVTYENPDLDGVACAFAYEEFKNKNNQYSKFLLFGKHQDEVEFLFKKFSIPKPITSLDDIEQDEIVLVDASDLRGLSKNINPDNIVEVIDHRKYYNKANFPNAIFNIELVGAAATIIAEKFYNSNTAISDNSSVLLFYAIVSNTINFKANVTTNKDVFYSNWLKNKIGTSSNYIKEMFEYKTRKLEISKQSFLDSYSAFFTISEKKIGIIQLELINMEHFFNEHMNSCLTIMNEIQYEFDLNFLFITGIDINEGLNMFLASEINSENLLSELFKITFKNKTSKRYGVIMRKEIVPLLINHLEK